MTATLTGGNVANKTVEFFNGSTSLGTSVTNSNGVATITYASQGIGDVSLTASVGSFSSEICSIEDIYYANIGITDKSSDFDIGNAWTSKNVSKGTITVTNDNEWYTVSRSNGGSNYAFIPLSPLTGINQAFTFSCIIEANSNGTYCGLYGENRDACWSTAVPCRVVKTTTGSYDNWNKLYDYSMSQGIYRMEITFNGTSYNYKLYDSNEVLQKELSTTMVDRLNNTSNTVKYGIVIDNNRNLRIKNIKAKLL